MKGYQSHESFWADLRMYLQLFKQGILLGLILQVIILIWSGQIIYQSLIHTPVYQTPITIPHSAIVKYYIPMDQIMRIPNWQIDVEPELQGLFRGYRRVLLKDYRLFLNYYTNNSFENARELATFKFKLSFLAYIFTIIYIIIFVWISRNDQDEKFIRGAQLLSIKMLNRLLKKKADTEPGIHIQIGQTIIPREMENKHLLLMGTAGSGKSVLLNQLIRQITLRRKYHPQEKAVIYDLKGEFVAKQMQPYDILFSPFDQRSVKWSFFNEIKDFPDYDIIAKSLYHSPDVRDEFWYNCAKDVFRTGLVYLARNHQRANRDIWEFFSQTLEEMKTAFQTLPLAERSALKHIDKADSNQSASIISILQERLQFFRYLADMDGDFCFRDYIQSKTNGNLYILNIDQYKEIFKPLMTFAMDTIIRETLSMPDNLNQRYFFIIDELGSLNRLDSLLDLLTVGRSRGASLICANQDLGRIKAAYGASNTTTFFNNFNTTFMFRIHDPETAEFLSKSIGEKQVVKQMESQQMSPKAVGDRKGFSDQEKYERIIIPSEFQNLKNFESILKVSTYGVAQMKIPQLFYPTINRHFMMKTFAELPGDEINTDGETADPNWQF